MAAQMKLADLPIATTIDSRDIMLVSDVTYGVSRKVSFYDLNKQLSIEDLSDYALYVSDIQQINDQIDLIIGDGTWVHDLSEIDELVTDLDNKIEIVQQSLKTLIDTLRENVDNDIRTMNQVDQALINRVERAEEYQLQAGLASGYLFVKEFKTGG